MDSSINSLINLQNVSIPTIILNMENDVYKKAIECLPMFFDVQLQFDSQGAGIFEPLRKIIGFDEAYIFFLSPDSVKLRYICSADRTLDVDDEFPIDLKVKLDLFSRESLIIDANNQLIKTLKLKNNKSFLISKLIVRTTVFGFILLCKRDESYYNQQDIEVATAIGAIISYKVKDVELSDIFKIQLMALQEGIVQTKDAYKTIKQQNFKILESDKIKNEFLANVSHELRTPLNAIIGFSEMLSNELFGDLNEKQSEYVRDINVSGIHLLGMINEILDISKIESNAMKLNRNEFLLSLAISEVVNIVKPLLDKKSINIEKRITKDGLIYADFQKIRQILYNLLSNAIKFTHERGKIIVKAKISKGKFILEIKDNGIGIAQKDKERIFGKFVQLENAYTKRESSTGLGLAITKELVEMHRGTITVKSEIGKGASFIVEIPMLSEEDFDQKNGNVVNFQR